MPKGLKNEKEKKKRKRIKPLEMPVSLTKSHWANVQFD